MLLFWGCGTDLLRPIEEKQAGYSIAQLCVLNHCCVVGNVYHCCTTDCTAAVLKSTVSKHH